MRKKLIALASIVIIFLSFHACEFNIPSGVEIIIGPEIGVQMRPGDLNSMIDDAIRDAVAGKDNGISTLRYNGYNYSGNKQVQTYLIQYDILKKEPLTFLDDLDEIFDFKLDLGDLSRDIDLSDLANLDDEMQPSTLFVDVTELTKSAADKLNDNNFETDVVLPIGIGNLPSDSFEYAPFAMEGFTSVTFSQGTLSFDLEYTLVGELNGNFCAACGEPTRTIILPDMSTPSVCYCGIDFVFGDIVIENDDYDEIPIANSPILFDTNIRTQTIKFNLEGYTLKNPKVVLAGFEDSSTSGPKYVDIKIISNNPLSDPVVQGIEGLELEERIEVLLKALGEPDHNPIVLDFGNSGFVHAQVKTGSINFNIDLPSEIKKGETYINFYNNNNEIDNTLDIEIYLLQDPADYIGGGTHYSGLSSCVSDNSIDDTLPWEYTGGKSSLAKRHINYNPEINIINGSKITLPEGKVSFMLSDADLVTNVIAITVTPEIDIEEFSIVHIDPHEFLDTTPLEPVSIENAAKYLKEIKFNTVGVKLIFGQIDIPGFEIMITEPNLGINPGPASTYCDIIGNTNSGDMFTKTNFIWDLASNPVDELQFEFDLKKKNSVPGSKEVIDIADLTLSNNKLVFQIDYEVYFNKKRDDNTYDWEYAMVDLSNMGEDGVGGTFPAEDEEGIDLASMFELLEGFTFEEVKAYLYINGPARFFNLQPDISMEVDYDGYKNAGIPKFDLFVNPNDYINGFLNLAGKNSAIINLDPKGTGAYTGALPEKDKTFEINIKDIMKDMPSDLRFAYDTLLDDMRIEPHQIEKDNSSALNELNAVMLMVLPLILKASADGADLEIPNLFDDKDDVFDRKKPGDSSYMDFIKALTIKIQLPGKLFSGGTFYMTEAGEEGTENELLSFPLRDSRNQEFKIDGKKLEQINKIVPYKIVRMGVRFPEGTILEIPNNLGAIRVEVDADLHYELEW